MDGANPRQARARDREACLLVLNRLGPRAVYGMLLSERTRLGFRRGWEMYVFEEIFLARPRIRDWGDPADPDPALKRWLDLRPKRSKKRC
jgi:hypothetical protein